MPVSFDTPLKTNDQSIERVLAAGLPVLLVFTDGPAPDWLAQGMQELARKHAGKLLVAQVALKDNPQSAGRFQIRSTPTCVAFKDGQALSQGGLSSAAELQAHADFLLGQGPRPAPPAASQAQTAQAAGNAPAHPLTVSDADFEAQVMRSSVPVLVDFWAPWCGPCRMVAPILDKLAREAAGRLKIAKLNVDENPHSAGRFHVQSIPTMIVVRDGKVIDQWVGALPEQMLRARIAHLLK